MPKIYGKVQFLSGILTCSICGYHWRANESEINDIKEGRKVTCIHCRAMNYLKPGQIIPKNTNFKLGSTVSISNPDDLRGDNYQDKLVNVLHLRCKRSFKAKLLDVRQGNLECPHCKVSIKKPLTEAKSIKKVDKLIELVDEADKIEEADRIPTKSNDNKIGKILHTNTRILNIDEERGVFTIQCIKCGTEETRDLSLLKRTNNKDKAILCSRCSKKEISIEQLRKEYLGKIFNGQIIDDIYYGEKGEILCNLVCMKNKTNLSLAAYIKALKDKNSASSGLSYGDNDIMHTQVGMILGDVINRRCYCKVCSEQKLLAFRKFKALLSCPNIDDFRRMGKSVKLEIDSLTVGDFYSNVKSGTLCEYCTAKNICKAAKLDPRNNLSLISAQLDMQDSLVNDMMDITVSYPGMFQFKESDSENVGILPDKDLIVIKDAFMSRDGSTYKTCKCRLHGTEMVLSDSEIAEFSHEQCKESNAYMQFFDMSSQTYLGKVKDKKK